jgi:hypothetical protein
MVKDKPNKTIGTAQDTNAETNETVIHASYPIIYPDGYFFPPTLSSAIENVSPNMMKPITEEQKRRLFNWVYR